jgi:hypothetical protein
MRTTRGTFASPEAGDAQLSAEPARASASQSTVRSRPRGSGRGPIRSARRPEGGRGPFRRHSDRTLATGEDVVSAVATNAVGPVPAPQLVAAASTFDPVAAPRSCDIVVAGRALDLVSAWPGCDEVAPATAEEGVRALAQAADVVVAARDDEIAPAAEEDAVVAGTAVDEVVTFEVLDVVRSTAANQSVGAAEVGGARVELNA